MTVLSAFQHLFAEPPAGFLGDAVREAIKGIGRTRPNPAVGCVVVDGGIVVGRGFHPRAGDRHAEVVALDDAGACVGATAYVTLEPCGHHGRTPPCVDRLIKERVSKVVVGAVDPNPKMNGQSLQKLRDHGIDVEVATGDDAAWAQAVLLPFATSMTKQRPYVVLKVATSLDGKIATHTGSSRWITGPDSRRLVHRLRDAVDAVVTGSGTVLADDPALTVRDVAGRDPLRVVLDRRHRVPKTARVFQDDNVVVCDGSIEDALAVVFARGVCAVMVEAGPGVASAFVEAGLVDEVWWFSAPIVIGGDGRDVFGALGVSDVNAAVSFDVVARTAVGVDLLTVLRRR